MSTFEFVLVSFAIIVGLGVSEVLAGWADQIRARHRLQGFPLQIVSSAFVLYMSLQYLWLLWLGRHVEWTFPLYLGVAGPALALTLAARVSRADTSRDAPSVRDQYFQASPAVYSLLAIFPFLITLLSFVSGFRDVIPNPPNLVAVSIVRLAVLLVYASMALSKSERFHWLGIALIWLAAIGFLTRMGARLAAGAAG